jgi:hypothetical protein
MVIWSQMCNPSLMREGFAWGETEDAAKATAPILNQSDMMRQARKPLIADPVCL